MNRDPLESTSNNRGQLLEKIGCRNSLKHELNQSKRSKKISFAFYQPNFGLIKGQSQKKVLPMLRLKLRANLKSK